MAEDKISSLAEPYKILNVTITTNDPLTAMVLTSARSVKRLNAVLGMMLEAYLATPEGRVMAAQQLRMPVADLEARLPDAPVPKIAAVSPVLPEVPASKAASAGGINFDKICA